MATSSFFPETMHSEGIYGEITERCSTGNNDRLKGFVTMAEKMRAYEMEKELKTDTNRSCGLPVAIFVIVLKSVIEDYMKALSLKGLGPVTFFFVGGLLR